MRASPRVRAPVGGGPPPLPVPEGRLALFLDFDGTLVDFAPTPDAVRPDPTLVELLRRLSAATG